MARRKRKHRLRRSIKNILILTILGVGVYFSYPLIESILHNYFTIKESSNDPLDIPTLPYPLNSDTLISQNISAYNLSTSEFVYSKAADETIYPASITKIMTVLVALDHISNYDEIVNIDATAYQRLLDENGSSAGFVSNDEVSYWDLLYGTMLASGTETSNTLAIQLSGSIENFVDLMNAKAKQLNMKSTHFVNVDGLHDEDHYSSTQDIVQLLDYALQNEVFKTIFTTKQYQSSTTNKYPYGLTIESTVLRFTEDLNTDQYGVLGGKSGTTYEAGQCWVTLATIGEEQFIIVMMNAPFTNIYAQDRAQITDTYALLKYMHQYDILIH